MKLLAIKPMLYTRQVKETVDFYTGTLGFNCVNFMDDWAWAALSRDNIEIMVAIPNAHLPFEKPEFTGSFYITTDAVDIIWNEIKGKVKEKAGQVTNNPDLEAEGQDEKIGGKVQKKIGQVEKVLGG